MSQRPNEKWWYDHGRQWLEEIARRREATPYYLLQEAFLAAYFGQCAPARVLEFGCGFGRHLSYLRELNGLDVHGCDQSPTMLAGIESWAGPQWREGHVRLIDPRRPLPYEDKSFDVVFTVSVLIHVRPDDVPAVLRELTRVARWHVLHIENAPTASAVMTCADHEGCWAHPLEAMYRELGVPAEALPAVGTVQGVWRASLDSGRPAPQTDMLARRLRAVDEACLHLTGRLRESDEQLRQNQTQILSLQAQLAEQAASSAAQAQVLTAQLEAAQTELAATAAQLRLVQGQLAALESQRVRFQEAVAQAQRIAAAELAAQRALRAALAGGN
jgi:SAM-dependent methyltransferase